MAPKPNSQGKRPFLLVNLAILLAGLVLLGSSDMVISAADTSIPDNEVTSSGSGEDDSAAIATVGFWVPCLSATKLREEV